MRGPPLEFETANSYDKPRVALPFTIRRRALEKSAIYENDPRYPYSQGVETGGGEGYPGDEGNQKPGDRFPKGGGDRSAPELLPGDLASVTLFLVPTSTSQLQTVL